MRMSIGQQKNIQGKKRYIPVQAKNFSQHVKIQEKGPKHQVPDIDDQSIDKEEIDL